MNYIFWKWEQRQREREKIQFHYFLNEQPFLKIFSYFSFQNVLIIEVNKILYYTSTKQFMGNSIKRPSYLNGNKFA